VVDVGGKAGEGDGIASFEWPYVGGCVDGCGS
jgi:hypothetical protein